jgi:hypothetical protein
MDQLFAVILNEARGAEQFRTTISAPSLDATVEKAAPLAVGIGSVVELVWPVPNLPAPEGTRYTESAIARSTALRIGAMRYRGQPCHYGHGRLRYASSGACIACAEEAGQRRRERRTTWKPLPAGQRPTPPEPQAATVVWWKPGYRSTDER